jgi:chemotaxis protein methyltransferase CheR
MNDLAASVEACELSAASLARVARFITTELGIKMPDSKMEMLQSRFLRRTRELGLRSIEQYVEHFFAADSAAEREHLINAVTTNKTLFFREPEHFDFLTRTVLPELCASARDRPADGVKVWSAGCSSGEEPYTLAMVLAEFGKQRPQFEFGVLGTDVSTRALHHARDGIYQSSQVEPVPAAMRARYLLRSRDSARQQARVIPALRRRVSLHRLNLMDQDYRIKDAFHAVFFRNVMIHFDRPTQEAVVNRICRHLAPGGYLFVGHSESLTGLDIPVRPVRASVFRKPQR